MTSQASWTAALLGVALSSACSLVVDSSDFTVVDAASSADSGADRDAGVPDGGQCSVVEDCPARANASVDCVESACVITSCSEAFADCDGDLINGCERDLDTDVSHCGTCDFACMLRNSTPGCTDGVCVIDSCLSDFADCNSDRADGCEADLRSPSTCGDCARTCPSSEPICDARGATPSCVADCSGGGTLCGMSCIDITSDPLHCGACNMVCADVAAAAPTCESSVCGFSCNPGFADCNASTADGCEIDVRTDIVNCGACGTRCEAMNATWACASSACGVVGCLAGFGDCNTDPVDGCESDLQTDAMHCGACGDVCAGPCVGGECDPFIELDGAIDTTCALRSSGRVLCWGINAVGQHGRGNDGHAALPAAMLDGAGAAPAVAIDIAVGQQHTCHIARAGTIHCAGRGADGELGRGNVLPSELPVPAASSDGSFAMRTFTQIDSAAFFTCAVDDLRRVWCWGRNVDGQMGRGTSGPDQLEPLPVTLAADVLEVEVGGNFACALLVDGTVRCWGLNTSGQLGNGTTTSSSSPVTVSGLTNAVALTTGNAHACAATMSGDLYCWGESGDRQLGFAATTDVLTATRVPSVTGVTAVSAGFGHTCVTAGGVPRCFGQQGFGQLGNGIAAGATEVPVAPSPIGASTDVRAHYLASCAIDGASLYCWGDNRTGNLGVEETIVRRTPTAVASLTGVTDLTAGVSHSCAVASGQAYCWGLSANGQTGYGGNLSTSSPRLLSRMTTPTQMDASVLGSCVLDAGQAHCFGSNLQGRLGDGGTSTRFNPTLVQLAGTEAEVRIADEHACARQGGTVYCWGRNHVGQLGRGTTGSPDATPGEPVITISDATGITLGEHFSCALRAGGTVSCWGAGGRGQLGNGTTVSNAAPQTVMTLSRALDLDAGYRHACAIERPTAAATSGQVRCWGENVDGQVGNTTRAATPVPFAVPGMTSAVSVTAGASHSCAALASGQVHCWGTSERHQLGDGSGADSAVPVRAGTLTDAIRVESGGDRSYHTCALRSGGTLVCWGACEHGACGTAEALTRAVPAPVLGL